MRRLPVAAFVTLAVATVGAFFVTQHLKVSTPLLAGFPAPHPAAINPIDPRTCQGVYYGRTGVSFYLLHRSDNVDVDIVNQSGAIVDTLASGVAMRVTRRHTFVWDGRTSNGSVAPDGIYYMKVSLIHQGRYVLISNNAGPRTITVKTIPPRPRVTSVRPELIAAGGLQKAAIRYSAPAGLNIRVLVYRTDLPGGPRVVKTYVGRRDGFTNWNGTLQDNRPAPQGTYLIGLEVTDQACNTGTFPAERPFVPGTTPGAGVTVRSLAAQPPLTPVPAGGTATVYVDARQHVYDWQLRAAGASAVLASGHTGAVALPVPVPSGARATGLYELTLRYASYRTTVPIVGAPGGASGARVLVVVPSLTWQGGNPVDDDGDGIPNTLTAGYPIGLDRPLVDGLPPGWGSLSGLVTRLRRDHLDYALTTDLALAQGTGPALHGHAGVVLAGDETWVPPALSSALRSYVAGGGHVLSLGIDSLRRRVTLSGQRVLSPSAPSAADIFGARFGAVTVTHGAFILAGHDRLRLFTNTSGAYRGFATYQPFTSVTPPLTIASAAGPTTSSSAIIGFRLGSGTVIEAGLPGFGSALAHNFDAQQILSRLWTVISR